MNLQYDYCVGIELTCEQKQASGSASMATCA